jgi:type I restriction enzyme S subunit
MRKVLKYPNYKESDVEWLGSIPEHCKIVKAKRILREVSIKNHPDEPLLAATQTKGVIPKSLYENTTVTASKNFETLKLVRKGDFVISLRSFQGGIEYAHYQGIISPAYTILEPQEEVIHNYYRYLLKSKRYISGLTLLVTGIREGQNIDTSKFKDSFLPLPPKEEQTAIARFLDYKLAKINRFIQKKKQLIKLLNEQKAAIINQAVTKGLDPNAKMKDSGIEWLGEIPEHWEVRKFKHFTKILSGYSPEQVEFNEKEGIDYFKVEQLNNVNNEFRLNESSWKVKIQSTMNCYEKGLLLIPKRGAAISTNKVAISVNICLFDTNVMGLRLDEEIVDIDFISLWLKNRNLIEIADTTTIPQINNKHIYPLQIAIPQIAEQKMIVDYLKMESNKIALTISKIEKELALTEEYKTALIAEAVTGKIDVRSYEVPEIMEEETYEEIEEEISMAAEDAAEFETVEE